MPAIALYAGTFDPLTAGHLSVIERALPLCEELIVLVAHNESKRPLFSVDERGALIRAATAHLPAVRCDRWAGLVIDYARAHRARYLIRGVRGGVDVAEELALALGNYLLAPEVTTLFVPARPDLADVSSSALKALARQGADLSRWCPAVVERALVARLAPRAGAPLRRGYFDAGFSGALVSALAAALASARSQLAPLRARR
jgi:pantetheine-phosphate adenylyltransferase